MTNVNYSLSLSIIIVYFGDYEALTLLLNSIKNNKIRHSYEIIIVNNKLDENIERRLKSRFRYVSYFKSIGNVGYGKGNNFGIKHSKGKYLFIVNPDTRIIGGKVDSLINFFEKKPDVAIVAPNLVDTDGNLFEKQGTRVLTPIRALFSLTILSRVFPNNRWLRDYYMLDVSKSDLREVDVAPGSAFMIRSSIFRELKGFDENFFLYFEEMDLCKRIKDLRARSQEIFMTPELVLEHDWSPYEGNRFLDKIFKQSRFYYFKKHYGLFVALITETFARISSLHILMITVLVLLGLINGN